MNPKSLSGFVRPVRTLHFMFITLLGALLAGVTNYFSLVFALLSSIFSWQFAVFINDYFDIRSDSINKKPYPLVKGFITKKQTSLLIFASAIVTTVISTFSSPINSLPFFSAILFLFFGIAYSSPPIRLKKYPLIASSIIAIGTILAFSIGYFSQSSIISTHSIKFITIISIIVALGVNVKDLWDIKGDKADGILSIPILLGEKRGKYSIIFLIFLALLISTILIFDPILLALSILCFLPVSYIILNFKRYKYRDVILIFYLYVTVLIIKLLI